MHEVSLVLHIVDIATTECQTECQRAGGELIVAGIDLSIGRLAGVEPEALALAWPVATRGSCLDGVSPHIRWIPALAHCPHCARDFPLTAWYDPCPRCDTHGHPLVQGRELRVEALTLVAAPVPAAPPR